MKISSAMDRVKQATKCVECLQTIESPVLLPCSDSICEKHVNLNCRNSIICGGCGVEHQIPKNVGFPKNKALEEIISAKISFLDFGETHAKAKEQCTKIEGLLKSMDLLEKGASSYAYEEIDKLRNRVHLKSENLKLSVDQKTEKLLEMLKEYQKNCEKSIESMSNNLTNRTYRRGLYKMEESKFDQLRNKAQEKLRCWRNELNEIKFNESRWSDIIFKSKEIIEDIESSIKDYKMGLMLGEVTFNKKSSEVKDFENINIDNTKNCVYCRRY